VLQTIYRIDPTDHPFVFRACIVLKQLSITNGEKLFKCGYKDPPFSNNNGNNYDGDDDADYVYDDDNDDDDDSI
jgi:hypothetical protein